MEKRVLNVDEASKVLGLGRSKVYDLVRTGEIKSITLGRRRLIPVAALDELLGYPAPSSEVGPVTPAAEAEGHRKPVAWVEGNRLVIDLATVRSFLWPWIGRANN